MQDDKDQRKNKIKSFLASGEFYMETILYKILANNFFATYFVRKTSFTIRNFFFITECGYISHIADHIFKNE